MKKSYSVYHQQNLNKVRFFVRIFTAVLMLLLWVNQAVLYEDFPMIKIYLKQLVFLMVFKLKVVKSFGKISYVCGWKINIPLVSDISNGVLMLDIVFFKLDCKLCQWLPRFVFFLVSLLVFMPNSWCLSSNYLTTWFSLSCHSYSWGDDELLHIVTELEQNLDHATLRLNNHNFSS